MWYKEMARKYFLTIKSFLGGLMWIDVLARIAVDLRGQLAQPVVLQIDQDFLLCNAYVSPCSFMK